MASRTDPVNFFLLAETMIIPMIMSSTAKPIIIAAKVGFVALVAEAIGVFPARNPRIPDALMFTN